LNASGRQQTQTPQRGPDAGVARANQGRTVLGLNPMIRSASVANLGTEAMAR
jgi:hypothetical protein